MPVFPGAVFGPDGKESQSMRYSLTKSARTGDSVSPFDSNDQAKRKDTPSANVVRARCAGSKTRQPSRRAAGSAALGAIVPLMLCLGASAEDRAPTLQTEVQQAPAPQVAPSQDPLPDFPVIQQAVEQFFATLEDYQDGDLIHQSLVEQALDRALDTGWDPKTRDAIVKRTLADGSFLVKTLSSPAGRKFMRRVARQQGAYSRLDRLSAISRGERLIRDLIRIKDGDKMIEYLATTRGGQTMGRMMAATPRGVDLNKPTGRIYTADEFLAVLKEAWQVEEKARESAKKGQAQPKK